MPYPQLDPAKIRVRPLAERKSKSAIADILIDPEHPPKPAPQLQPLIAEVAARIIAARERQASVILAFGAHLIKNGAASLLIKMMEQGWITHLATNGAGGIHDWEFAFHGRSEEDVQANVAQGCFGTWDETGRYLNWAVQLGALRGMGYGESIGAMILEDGLSFPILESLRQDVARGAQSPSPLLPAQAELLQTMTAFNIPDGFMAVRHPFKQSSVFAQAVRLGVPLTVHSGIGYDIIYNHPCANGAALGRGSHTDFKIFAHAVTGLQDGVVLSVGSAIMAPQIFEKALSQVNNLRLQNGLQTIAGHLMVINDLQESSWDWTKGEPPKSSPDYYLRFLKSFYRMGGSVRYVAADNRLFLHHLYHQLQQIL